MNSLPFHPEQIVMSLPGQASDAAVARDYENVTDKVLLRWMCDGDSRALEHIISRYSAHIVAFSARYLNSLDLAKDVCQEVFLKLIDKPPAVLLYDNLGPWLFRVARNLSIDKRRRRKFEVTGDSEFPEPFSEGTPLTEATANNDLAVMRELIRKLPEEIREVVELRIYGDVPFKDIAVILNIPQGTALWRMHRALELLRIGWNQLL